MLTVASPPSATSLSIRSHEKLARACHLRPPILVMKRQRSHQLDSAAFVSAEDNAVRGSERALVDVSMQEQSRTLAPARSPPLHRLVRDRKSVVSGKRVSVGVHIGGRQQNT